MSEIFAPVKLLLRLKTRDSFNFTFNLHTKYTVCILFASSLLLCAQFAREPITCLPDNRQLQERIMETFCWVNGTFTIADDRSPRGIGTEMVSPGVGSGYYEAPKKYQHYYQWLSIVLLLQACLFYLPRYVWKVWEGGVLASLLPDADPPPPSAKAKNDQNNSNVAAEAAAPTAAQNRHYAATSDGCGDGGAILAGGVGAGTMDWPGLAGKKNPQLGRLLKYFRSSSHRRKAYVTKYMVCELLNSCNILGQIFLINTFFDDAFLYYGYNVLMYFCCSTEELRQASVSPMDELFPKLAKCTFYKFGPSGTVELMDALCVLGWNVIYEKIYFIMWWWFVILLIFTIINHLSRLWAFFSRKFRLNLLRNEAMFSSRTIAQEIVRKADFADVFVLCKIARQMKPELFNEFLEELCRERWLRGSKF